MFLLFGPPGVGKGTQADLVSNKYKLIKFSMGDILRDEVSLDTSVGNKVKRYLDKGTLAPDDVVVEIVEDFLIDNQKSHLLFDGFPRNLNQALNLEKMVAQLGLSINLALELSLSSAEIVKRVVNRRYCLSCGRIYNYITNPPQNDGKCDACNLKLVKRDDDNEEIIAQRLAIYNDQAKPLIDYYKSLGVYRQIEASGSPQDVFEKISLVLNGYIK